MRGLRSRLVFTFCSALALVACSPALNWREVRLKGLTAMLPCKPDQAQRTVQLADQDLTMEMVGCEAADGLFAISHVRVKDDKLLPTVREQWRQQTLAALRATDAQDIPFQLKTMSNSQLTAGGMPAAQTVLPQLVSARGLRPDGSAVVARLLWMGSGSDLYHVAVYAKQVSVETADRLFTGLTLQ